MRVRLLGLLGLVALLTGCGRSHSTSSDSPPVPSGPPATGDQVARASLDRGMARRLADPFPAAAPSAGAPGRRLVCRRPPAGEGCSYEEAIAPAGPEFADNRLTVKFKDRLREPADVIHAFGLRFADNCPSGGQDLDALHSRYHVRSVVPVFLSWFGTAATVPGQSALAERRKRFQESVSRSRAAFAARSKRAPANAEVPDLTNVYFFDVPAGTDIRRMALDYSGNENVEYAVPDYLARVNSLPNDLYLYTAGSWGQSYSDLWGIKKIGAPAAWDSATGLGVVVAVVDTGLDYNHLDIASNVWTNPAEASGSPGVDDDSNGYTDDVRGWDFAYGNADVMDRQGHGTHVAGTIAAMGNNGIGVIGVAYQAMIMPLKGLNDYGSGQFGNLANAITYAARNGADVISNSWGCFGSPACVSSIINDAVALARSLGCVVTFAAGNNSADVKYDSPGNLQNVITVASTGEDDSVSGFSNFGWLVDVAAPGGGPDANYNILSLRAAGTGSASYVVGTDYIRLGGTSMATPHVSGVAALLLSANPSLTVAQVESIIKHTAADQVGDPSLDTPGFDVHYGWGRLDAAAAVASAFTPPADPPIFKVVADPIEFVLPQSTCGLTYALPLDIYNLGGGTLDWSSSGPSWLTVTPSSGTNGSLSVLASVDSLSNQTDTLTLSPADNSRIVDLPVSEQVLSSVSIVNCDSAISRASNSQQWGPIYSNFNPSPPGIPDGAGGGIYVWNDYRNVSGMSGIYMQRVDSLGQPLWAANGLLLSYVTDYSEAPAIMIDGAGGAIIAWVEGPGPFFNLEHIRAQRVDASGNKLWGADGVWVCQASGGQLDPKLVPDGAGGAIISWTDLRSGYQYPHIYAQRVDSTGAALWQTDGALVTGAQGAQSTARMVADGSGGAFVTWEDTSVYPNWTVYAQRVDSGGNPLWAQGGIAIPPAGARVQGPNIVPDGTGGAIIAWNDLRSSTSNAWLIGDIYAARIDANGNNIWTRGGAPVVVGLTVAMGAYVPGYLPNPITMASDGKGGAFVVWHDIRNGADWDIYSQRLDSNGNRLWGQTGLPVTTAAAKQFAPFVISDGGDGAIYAWSDLRAGNADIFVQRLDATGNRLLGANGLWLEPRSGGSYYATFVTPYSTGGQVFPSLVPLANHRVLVTWDDYSNTTTNAGVDFAGKVIEFASNLTIAPASPIVPPNGSMTFTASGGSGGGFTWSLATNASGGTIDASTGAYTAGPTGNVTDVVQVTDSFENVATANVTVIANAFIAPATATVPPKGQVSFTASGGSGVGWTWSLATNASGGTIDASTGEYAAGPTGNVIDVVQVKDSLGTIATCSVTVTAGVSIAPASATVPPLTSLILGASGGSGTGYAWSLATNASGGSIDPTTGTYHAGSTSSVIDVVQVADSLGNTASAAITLTGGVSITPSAPALAPRASLWFEADGGSGAGYIWSLATNGSGGSIVSYSPRVGIYQAGSTGDATDVVEVTDSLGNTATASVTVSAGISIAPSSPTVAPLSSLDFGAAGGSGAGYTWLFSVDESGGSIDPTTGAYRAGPKGGGADVVYVIDSLANTASVSVTVTAGVTVRPAEGGGGCGCGAGGSGSASILLSAALFLMMPRRARSKSRPKAARGVRGAPA